jgi:hypothetical protein
LGNLAEFDILSIIYITKDFHLTPIKGAFDGNTDWEPFADNAGAAMASARRVDTVNFMMKMYELFWACL